MDYVSGETPKCSVHVVSGFLVCAARKEKEKKRRAADVSPVCGEHSKPWGSNLKSVCMSGPDRRPSCPEFSVFQSWWQTVPCIMLYGSQTVLVSRGIISTTSIMQGFRALRACVHAGLDPTNSSLPLPGRLARTLRDHPVWYQGKAPNLQPVAKSLNTFLVQFLFSTFVRPFSTVLPFLSDFQTGLGLCDDICV